VTPKIDQSRMYSQVTNHFLNNNCVGIFPEGGSHDRSDMLPLKAGAVIMTLGSMAEHENLEISIIPVGLNYFHPEKFRSRAVVEYGAPIKFDKRMVEDYKAGGALKRAVIEKGLEIIHQRLREVTVTAPSFDDFKIFQTTRSLYAPQYKLLTAEESLLITRRIAHGFEKMKDNPIIQKLAIDVKEYVRLLDSFGLSDHQAKALTFNSVQAVFRLFFNLIVLLLCFVLSAPGLILYLPIYLITSLISKKKAKEALAGSKVKIEGKDVMATCKFFWLDI
jgi:glycerol-3-phosphate O-acyltransferase/dihydroxyacetone phosphate acyltransferase